MKIEVAVRGQPKSCHPIGIGETIKEERRREWREREKRKEGKEGKEGEQKREHEGGRKGGR